MIKQSKNKLAWILPLTGLLFSSLVHAVADAENNSIDPHQKDLYQFEAKSLLNIDVDLSFAYRERAFINICQTIDGSHHEEICYLKTPLNNGKLTTRINVDNDAKNLTAEIWFLTEGMEPITFEWKRRSQLTWKIR